MADDKTRFDIPDIYLETESRTFLSIYGKELENQSEIIAKEKGIENEKTLDKVLSTLNYHADEYIVHGALLSCPYCKRNSKIEI